MGAPWQNLRIFFEKPQWSPFPRVVAQKRSQNFMLRFMLMEFEVVENKCDGFWVATFPVDLPQENSLNNCRQKKLHHIPHTEVHDQQRNLSPSAHFWKV